MLEHVSRYLFSAHLPKAAIEGGEEGANDLGVSGSSLLDGNHVQQPRGGRRCMQLIRIRQIKALRDVSAKIISGSVIGVTEERRRRPLCKRHEVISGPVILPESSIERAQVAQNVGVGIYIARHVLRSHPQRVQKTRQHW